jgi:hypothetical protein
MDRRERWADLQETMRLSHIHHQAKLWTSVPGIVDSFDPGTCTAVIQPAIGGIKQGDDGSLLAINLPPLHDVPVIFPRGGGCTLTFPVAAGDECLVIFSSRPIDAWWQSGGVQRPADARMHDMADGFALIGPMSKPAVPTGISGTTVQLRSDDGLAVFELDPRNHSMSFTAPGGLTINAPTLTLNAALSQGTPPGGGSTAATLIGPLDVTGDVTAAGKSVSTHHHNEHDGPSTSPPA